MATAPPEDQLTCSICLEVYKEPVSIPCGHNFCKACLNRHWAGKKQRHCPLCKDMTDKELNLRVNTEFREVVEKFKKQNEEAGGTSPIKPGQVPCDCCPGKQTRASKTCLVCLVSYCEKHLEHHLKVDALKRHKLTQPVHKLEDKICKSHNRIQEFFCRNDQMRVCALCTEHSDHDTVHLEEGYVDRSFHMGRRKEAVQETKPKTGAAAQNRQKGKGGSKPKGVKSNQATTFFTSPGHNEAPRHLNGCTCFPQVAGFSEEGMLSFQFNVKDRAVCHLGVVRMSAFRRRIPSPNHSWVITLQNDGRIERVHMYLDQKNGVLLFFDADRGDVMCGFVNCSFTEQEGLFIFYDPGQPLSCEQRVRRYVQKKVEERHVAFFIVSFALIILVFLPLLSRLS